MISPVITIYIKDTATIRAINILILFEISATKLAIFLSPIGSIIPAINFNESINNIKLITGERATNKMRRSPAVPIAFLISMLDAMMIESPSET